MLDLDFFFSDYASFYEATLDINNIIDHYEKELVRISKRAVAAEEEVENLQSNSLLAKETANLDLAHLARIEQLEKSGRETKRNLAEAEQKLKTALADHDLAKGEIEILKSELKDQISC